MKGEPSILFDNKKGKSLCMKNKNIIFLDQECRKEMDDT